MSHTRISKNTMYKLLKKTNDIRQIIRGLRIVSQNQSCIISRTKNEGKGVNRYGKFRNAIIRRIKLRDSIYYSDFRRYSYFRIGCSYLDYYGSRHVAMYLPR